MSECEEKTTFAWLCMNPWKWKRAEMKLNGKDVILNNLFNETEMFNKYIIAPEAKDPEVTLTAEDTAHINPDVEVKIIEHRTKEDGENDE